MDGLVHGRERREGGKERESKKERERLCGLGAKTDRLLMEPSTFRCSDEVLEHGVKYS